MIKLNNYFGFFVYWDSQTEVGFEKSKFGEKKSRFAKARFVKLSNEQVKRPHEIITQSNEISAMYQLTTKWNSWMPLGLEEVNTNLEFKITPVAIGLSILW